MDQASKTIIILGWYLGLGALIQSSVNSIWLAKKLGRQYCLYWGHSCIYQPGMIGSNCKNLGNIYPKLFVETPEHAIFTPQIYDDMLVYPSILNQATKHKTVDKLDAHVACIASGQTLPVNVEEIDDILTSDLFIIYQYLSIFEAITLAREAGLDINESVISAEVADIYKQHFTLSPEIRRRANDFWTDNLMSRAIPLGIHIRGSDKISETAIPSPTCYFHRIASTTKLPLGTTIFVATDQGSCLDAIRGKYFEHHVAFQNITRTQGDVGLHYMHQRSDYAFQHAVDVIIDVEVLSRCASVFAFPGSQIYWWLKTKKAAEQLPFQIYDVMPNYYDRYKASLYAFRIKGFRALLPLLSIPLKAVRRFCKQLFLERP